LAAKAEAELSEKQKKPRRMAKSAQVVKSAAGDRPFAFIQEHTVRVSASANVQV